MLWIIWCSTGFSWFLQHLGRNRAKAWHGAPTKWPLNQEKLLRIVGTNIAIHAICHDTKSINEISSCHQQVDAEAKHDFNNLEDKQSGYREPSIIGGCKMTEPMKMLRSSRLRRLLFWSIFNPNLPTNLRWTSLETWPIPMSSSAKRRRKRSPQSLDLRRLPWAKKADV